MATDWTTLSVEQLRGILSEIYLSDRNNTYSPDIVADIVYTLITKIEEESFTRGQNNMLEAGYTLGD